MIPFTKQNSWKRWGWTKALRTLVLWLSLATTGLHGEQLAEPFREGGPESGVPVGWKATDEEAVSIVKLDGVPYQRIRRGGGKEGSGGSSAIYYRGTEGSIREGQIKNFKASVVVRLGGGGAAVSSFRGVVLRAQAPTMSASQKGFWGYSVGFISQGEARSLAIYENPTGTIMGSAGSQRAVTLLSADLKNDVDYLLQISAAGRHLEAILSQRDGGEEIARIEYDDAMELPGYFGLRAAHANTGVNTYFRDLHIETMEDAQGGEAGSAETLKH